MKTIYLATAILLGISSSIAGVILYRAHALQEFCQNLPAGMSIAQVREAAEDRGLIHSMEPYAQMRIEAQELFLQAPSCRVFFNHARTIEYKFWQNS